MSQLRKLRSWEGHRGCLTWGSSTESFVHPFVHPFIHPWQLCVVLWCWGSSNVFIKLLVREDRQYSRKQDNFRKSCENQMMGLGWDEGFALVRSGTTSLRRVIFGMRIERWEAASCLEVWGGPFLGREEVSAKPLKLQELGMFKKSKKTRVAEVRGDCSDMKSVGWDQVMEGHGLHTHTHTGCYSKCDGKSLEAFNHPCSMVSFMS